MNSLLSKKWMKIPVFVLCLVPFGILLLAAFHDGLGAYFGWTVTLSSLYPSATLGANPVQFIQYSTGDWTLIFLIITLAITPARKLLHLPALIRYRRMVGLFAFFYVCMHFTTYIWLDQSLDFRAMLHDVAKRRFITVGFLAFVLMIPLAITSTKGWIRRLGGKNWTWLHRSIYVSAIAGVIHYAWLVKSDERMPALYGVLVGLLLLYRIIVWIQGRKRPKAQGAPAPQHPPTAETA
jgi:sulfoxide reductase heme-binding subunit YedZ